MELKIVYSRIALTDLRDIYDYIRRDSVRYATKEVKYIRLSINRLKSNPFLYKRFENTEDEFTRELVYKNYRIIYQIIPDEQINIITIHHHARAIANNPAFNTED
jgi:toxin ParE1/3/4